MTRVATRSLTGTSGEVRVRVRYDVTCRTLRGGVELLPLSRRVLQTVASS